MDRKFLILFVHSGLFNLGNCIHYLLSGSIEVSVCFLNGLCFVNMLDFCPLFKQDMYHLLLLILVCADAITRIVIKNTKFTCLFF